jgi:hypothetical protein
VTSMNCAAFDRWLDEAGSERESGAARDSAAAREADAAHAHAAGCARCAAALAASHAIDALLGAPAVAAPPAFTDAVMRRVAAASRARAARPAPWIESSAMPLWVRAAAEPPAVFAALLAALVAWRGDALMRAAAVAGAAAGGAWRAAPHAIGAWLAGAAPREASSAFSDPGVRLGLMMVAATMLCVASAPLYGWFERWSGAPSHARHSAPGTRSFLEVR